MSKLPVVDAHCHLFNIFFLTSEIGEVIWDKLWGNYPHMPEAGAQKVSGVDIDAIRALVDYYIKLINEISHAAFNNYEGNYEMLKKAYHDSFNTKENIIVYPLMMDIYYLYAEPLKASLASNELTVIDDPEKIFKEQFEKIREAINQRAGALAKESLTMTFQDINAKLNDIYNDIVSKQSSKSSLQNGVELSKGFEQEILGLMGLQKQYPDSVFPFFAIDPRRRGIIKALMEGRNFLSPGKPSPVSKTGPFFGIKFYPRIGYLPKEIEHKAPGFFQWCVDKDIPITFHSGPGGFPPDQLYPKWKYNDFGNPTHWKSILATYPKLRINFAHFGDLDKKDEKWADSIINLMDSYKNVYADISCYTDKDKLAFFVNKMRKNSILLDRVMFGTDFNLNLLVGLQPLKGYFDNFNPAIGKVFADAEFNSLARDNPAKFLNR